jgi:hypothetical protein
MFFLLFFIGTKRFNQCLFLTTSNPQPIIIPAMPSVHQLLSNYKRTSVVPQYGDITAIARHCGVTRETVRDYMAAFPRFPKLSKPVIRKLIITLYTYGFIEPNNQPDKNLYNHPDIY